MYHPPVVLCPLNSHQIPGQGARSVSGVLRHSSVLLEHVLASVPLELSLESTTSGPF